MTTRTWEDWARAFAGFHADVLKQSSGAGGRHLFDLGKNVRYGLTADMVLLGVSAEAAVEEDLLRLDISSPDEAPRFEEEPDLSVFSQEGSESESEEDNYDSAAAADRARAAAAARRVFLKQRGDPYNRETTIGFPLIGGRPGGKLVSGPLLYWSVNPTLKPEDRVLVLERPNPTPAMNTVLLSRFADDAAALDLVRDELLPDLLREDLNIQTVVRMIAKLGGIFAPLEHLSELENSESPLSAFLTEVNDLARDGRPVLSYSPVLVNGPRSYAFILDDLVRISKLSDLGRDSVAKRVFAPPPDRGIPDVSVGNLPYLDTTGGGRGFWFPDRSNIAQRRAAAKAERSRLLTIQGPPGTGKSQTIANMICDLVTEGKSVLVTSHTMKALEVVASKLPRVDQLAVSVLRGDKESIAKLRTELEVVQAVGNTSQSELQSEVAIAEQRLAEVDTELRGLDRRYSELSELEHKENASHARYGSIRDSDQIDPKDDPGQGNRRAIASQLREYAALLEAFGPLLVDMDQTFRPGGATQSRSNEQSIASALQKLIHLYDSSASPLPPEAMHHAQSIAAESGPSRQLLDELQKWADWISADAPEILNTIRRLSQTFRLAADGTEPSPVALQAVLESAEVEDLTGLRARWSELLDYFSESRVSGDGLPDLSPGELRSCLSAVEDIRRSGSRVVGWLPFSRCRRAAQTLEQVGFGSVSRLNVDTVLDSVTRDLEWIERQELACSLEAESEECIPAISAIVGTSTSSSVIWARRARAWLQLVDSLLAIAGSPVSSAPGSALQPLQSMVWSQVSSDSAQDVAALVESVRRRLLEIWGAVRVRDKLAELGVSHEEAVSLLTDVQRRTRTSESTTIVERLRRLVDRYPDYQRSIDLERTELATLGRTVRRLRREAIAGEGVPEWARSAARIETAIEAHRLGAILRRSLAEEPDVLSEYADRLAAGQRERMKVILEIVKRRRKLRVAEALSNPKIRQSLKRMRQLVIRKKKTNSLVTLKEQIDYRDVLKVLPCWICSVDDVARLFPLVPGLFDVLIIDEASQCEQAALLPLIVRARQAIVVGDRKQLNPSGARFLSVASLELLQQQHDVVDHERSGFLDGRKSLLEVAEASSDEEQFLDEHFRCDPSIISWSNDRHYDGKLRILTPRREKTFRPALRVEQLSDADEDRDRKVNEREAQWIVEAVYEMVTNGVAGGKLSIGVISPFRKQADLLNEMLYERFQDRPELLAHHQIVASTADGFQGDERDIIVYSFRYGPSSHAGSITTIQREEERLNVAFTRARRLGVCVISHSLDRFPRGAIRSFLEHSREAENAESTQGIRADRFDSEFEREVCEALRQEGFRVSTQEPCAGYFIDLVVEDDDGRVLGIECDGEWKRDQVGNLRPEDYQRQDILERAGWSIHRISGRSWILDPEDQVNKAIDALAQQPTAADRELALGPPVELPLKAGPVEPVIEPAPADLTDVLAPGQLQQTPTPVDRDPDSLSAAEEAPGAISTDSSHKGLEWLGGAWHEQVEVVKALWRWWIMDSDLEGSAVDTLAAIEERLEEQGTLSDAQVAYLRGLFFSALERGFNPEARDGLPVRPPPDVAEHDESASGERSQRSGDLTADDLPNLEQFAPVERLVVERLIAVFPRSQTVFEIWSHLVSHGGVDPAELLRKEIDSILETSEVRMWIRDLGGDPIRWVFQPGGL